MNSKYPIVGLYDHNADAYDAVKAALIEDDVAAIVHATGTGKSYIALQLAYDNPDKKILYVVPSTGIIEHIKEIINSNPNLDFERDFPNLEFRTYQSFINMKEEEIAAIEVDLLILDEFHHIGAPIWGSRINTLIDTHPDMKIFGMTAYTIRDRGTVYERDMAEPSNDEIFSNKVVSRYDICDAILDGVLPKPIYKTAYINLEKMVDTLFKKVNDVYLTDVDKKTYLELISAAKQRIHSSDGVKELVKKNIKKAGKYIYFCPIISESGVNDISTIKEETKKWFLELGLSEDEIVFYQSTSDMGIEGKNNRDAFYNDITLDGKNADGKLRVMFAINQYNEGIHAPNVDGVIMGRGTSSDIVFFEQLGRALAVRGENREQYEALAQHSIEELILLCKEQEIPVLDNYTKEDIIGLLLAPVVIDLTNNIDFIRELENNLKDRIKELTNVTHNTIRKTKIKNVSFDVEVENVQIYESLKYVMDRLTVSWDDKYALAQKYFEHYGNLKIPALFRTFDGINYDYNGIKLGVWINQMRTEYKAGSLSPDKIAKLNKINMKFKVAVDMTWEEKYNVALAFYKENGHFIVPNGFKTMNGIDYDESGFNLYGWKRHQKKLFQLNQLSSEQREKLKLIDLNTAPETIDSIWNKRYESARNYYNAHGDLLVPKNFKTSNGIDYDENGFFLSNWISKQKKFFIEQKLSEEKYKKLLEIGFITDEAEISWRKMYKLVQQYYIHYGNVNVSENFKTTNGYETSEEGFVLYNWIQKQKLAYKKGELDGYKINMLLELGIVFDLITLDDKWESYYQLATAYYNQYNNLSIPTHFKTINGYEESDDGVRLGVWLSNQKTNYRLGRLSEDRVEKLIAIGMNFEDIKFMLPWEKKMQLATNFFMHNGHLKVPKKFKTNNGIDYDENGFDLGSWVLKQRDLFVQGNLSEERVKDLTSVGMIFSLNSKGDQWQEKYNLAKIYFEHYGNLKIPALFKTSNGIDYDANGIKLGSWINVQRTNYKKGKLSSERIMLLEEIGMLFVIYPSLSNGTDVIINNDDDDEKPGKSL